MGSACGADEVGFGCCEPQRLGAARETTASRRHAWLGIALGATLNPVKKTQNTDPRSPPHSDYTLNAPADRSPWSFSPRRSLYVSGARA